MTERIEYAWIERDEAGTPVVAKIEVPGGRLATEPVELIPAEDVAIDIPYVHPDGRTGTARVTRLEARVAPPQVKRGADGLPLVRPIVGDPKPVARPWQVVEPPVYEIGDAEVTRRWNVVDRDLDTVKAERADAIRAYLHRRVLDALALGEPLDEIQAAGRAAMQVLAEAKTAQDAFQVGVVVAERKV